MTTNNSLAGLSEHQLLRHFGNLVRQDRRHTAALLTAVAEIDERKLWAKQACPSMFAFCVERFHMSESMAGKRIWAARTARRFPVIFQMVARGELHLSAIVKIARHLTEENHREILRRARRKSSREIDVLVAELAPRPEVPSRIRALPRSTARGVQPTGRVTSSKSTRIDTCASQCIAQAAASSLPSASAMAKPAARDELGEPRPRAQVVPLSPRRYKIEITVDQETHDKLRMLQDLLVHQLTSADPAVIVCRAVDLLLDRTLEKKAAVTDRARAGRRCSDRRTRAIPAALRREVWRRDGVVAHSSTPGVDAARPRAGSSTITSDRTGKADGTRRATSRCAAGRTISTRRIWTSGGISCVASEAATADIPRGMLDAPSSMNPDF